MQEHKLCIKFECSFQASMPQVFRNRAAEIKNQIEIKDVNVEIMF